MPWTTARQQHLASASTKANEVQAEKRSTLASETAKNDLWDSLQAANSCIAELEQLLAERTWSAINCNQHLIIAMRNLKSIKIFLLFGSRSMRKHIMSFICSAKLQNEGKKN